MTEKITGFWSSIPGILTGLAAVITAVTGLYVVIVQNSDKAPVQTDPTTSTGSENTQPPNFNTDTDSNNSGSGDSSSATSSSLSVPTDDPVHTASEKPADTSRPSEISQIKVVTAFATTGTLVDCNLFPTVNTTASLMGWSNYYQKQILSANGVKSRAMEPCNKTIDYRGMAHCKAPEDAQIRQALLETLQLCRTAGIEWQDINHSTIIK